MNSTLVHHDAVGNCVVYSLVGSKVGSSLLFVEHGLTVRRFWAISSLVAVPFAEVACARLVSTLLVSTLLVSTRLSELVATVSLFVVV